MGVASSWDAGTLQTELGHVGAKFELNVCQRHWLSEGS